MSKLEYVPDILAGRIKLIETGYAPRNVAILLGRRDTRIRYYGYTVGEFANFGKEMIGKIDFNNGEMELMQNVFIDEIRADEPTLQKIRELLTKEQP